MPYEKINDLTGDMGIFSVQSQKVIISPVIKVSMQELKNRVVLADDNKKSQKYITVENKNSIKKYGLLQEVETIDTSKFNNLSKIAENKLKSLNKLSKTISLTMLGNYRMKKGVIMPINCEEIGVKGDFLIKSSNHTIEANTELVSVNLKLREGVSV